MGDFYWNLRQLLTLILVRKGLLVILNAQSKSIGKCSMECIVTVVRLWCGLGEYWEGKVGQRLIEHRVGVVCNRGL
jgi:hypothetical protein